jgi:hypothetical protein
MNQPNSRGEGTPNNNRTTAHFPLNITLVISQHKARNPLASQKTATSRKAAEEVKRPKRI